MATTAGQQALTGPRPHVLRDYAFLGDGERGAVLGPDGDVAWLCAPYWDSDAVFAGLMGGPGRFVVAPADPWHTAGGSYLPRTLAWRAHIQTRSGRMECHSALALPADPHRLVLLRRVRAVDGDAVVRVDVTPRARFGADRPREMRREGTAWRWRCGALDWRLSGLETAVAHADGLAAELRIPEGGHHDLVLEIADGALGSPPEPDPLWEHTLRSWRERVPDCAASAAPRDAAHAFAVLHGLTSAAGGMAAAATTALPEFDGGGRNYDYRYAWIRDQCYAGIATAAHGPHPLVAGAAGFVAARLLADGPDVHPAYTTRGGRVSPERHSGLPGYPGGGDRIGNHAATQRQLDCFGEALQLFAAADRHGMLDADGAEASRIAVRAIRDHWKENDAGVWELSDAWWTHTRLAMNAGLHAVAGRHRDLGPDAAELADAITTETRRLCTHRDGGWQRAPDDERVDAALVLPAVRAAALRGDPRTEATLVRVRRDLLDDGYVYRFRHGDAPLGDREGAFLLCGFMLTLAEASQGGREAAVRRFERTRAACGAAGLFAEEYDVAERQLRGNLPQAFVHALLLESSVVLGSGSEAGGAG
ncbi:MAG: glycoside hydrolase family 15 protein [Streptomycetaceae bacterium]|nr:glycoside hydrolase family 15 protein [Streptomycetaceae bacterium]